MSFVSPCWGLTHQNLCIRLGRIHYTWLVETEIAFSTRRVTVYSTTAKEIVRHHVLDFSGTNSVMGKVFWRFREVLWSDLSSDRKTNYFRARRIRWCRSYVQQHVLTYWNLAARVLSIAKIKKNAHSWELGDSFFCPAGDSHTRIGAFALEDYITHGLWRRRLHSSLE